jgi:hypothetical protein
MPEAQKPTGDEVAAEIEQQRKRVAVRALDLSFNELADMHEAGELHISPEYQRTFRWTDVKQSQFIESILLEMPVPPIYVVEVREGEWELIDGLQRLSTYLHFRGQLDLPDRTPPIEKGKSFLTLTGCNIVPRLNGLAFSDLSTANKYRVRRATLRVEVVRKGEDNTRFAYYMFNRLNTGGEPLSDQEARNCSIRLLGTRFNEFIIRLAKVDDFQAVIEETTEEFRARMGAEELALRFFAFKNNLQEYIHDIEPFLTDYMERVTDEGATDCIPFDYTAEEAMFRKTFRLLAKTLGSKACRRWVGSTYGGGFSMGHYEAFALGLGTLARDLPDDPGQDWLERLKEELTKAKQDSDLRPLTTGGGKNFRRIYERKIALVVSYVREAL